MMKEHMSQESVKVRTHVVRDAEQLRALRTPVRNEVLKAVQQLGPCSVAEIADRLGRVPSSIHYHVLALVEAGLLVKLGVRHTGYREESVFEAIAEDIVLDRDTDDPAYRRAIRDIYRATMGLAQRQLERSLKTGEDESRRGMLLQRHIRLSPAARETIRQQLLEVAELARELDDPEAEDEYVLTSIFSGVTT